MATFSIELSGKANKGQKEHLLMLRITVKRVRARIALMYSVNKNQFIPRASNFKFIRASKSNHAKINSYLEEQINKAKAISQQIINEGKNLTASEIKKRFLENKGKSFNEYAKKKIEALKVKGDIGSYKKYHAVLSSIEEFVGPESVLFDEIDVHFIDRYKEHLIKAGKKQTTVHGYISKIRTLFNDAIHDREIEIGITPFLGYRIKHGSPSKDRLTMEEINTIENLEIEENTLLWHVRNAFLFAFYNAGIRISDILLMTWDNIQDGRLVYIMYKTHKPHSLVLKEKPLAILEKYRNRNEYYLFPFLSDRYDYSDPMFKHNQIGAKTAPAPGLATYYTAEPLAHIFGIVRLSPRAVIINICYLINITTIYRDLAKNSPTLTQTATNATTEPLATSNQATNHIILYYETKINYSGLLHFSANVSM